MDIDWLAAVRERFDTRRARTVEPSALFVWNVRLEQVGASGWTCERVRRILTPPDVDLPPERMAAARVAAPSAAPVVSQALWRSHSDPGALIKVDAFECASRNDADDLLLRLLGEFESPLVQRKDDAPGEVAFGGPGDGLLLFARANVVYLCRNAERRIASVKGVASELDRLAIGEPPPRRSRADADDADGSDEHSEVVLLDDAFRRRAATDSIRFFAPAGEIVRAADRIVFRGPARAARRVEQVGGARL